MCPVIGSPRARPVAASHSRNVPSLPPERIRRPSGPNATLVTTPVCPVIGSPRARPVAASHSRNVPSLPPERIRRPSGPNTTLVTTPVCPVIGSPRARPVAASHSRNVPSLPPERIRRPSGPNATLVTTPVCPVIGSPRARPVAASHSRNVPSAPLATIRLPSGLNAVLLILVAVSMIFCSSRFILTALSNALSPPAVEAIACAARMRFRPFASPPPRVPSSMDSPSDTSRRAVASRSRAVASRSAKEAHTKPAAATMVITTADDRTILSMRDRFRKSAACVAATSCLSRAARNSASCRFFSVASRSSSRLREARRNSRAGSSRSRNPGLPKSVSARVSLSPSKSHASLRPLRSQAAAARSRLSASLRSSCSLASHPARSCHWRSRLSRATSITVSPRRSSPTNKRRATMASMSGRASFGRSDRRAIRRTGWSLSGLMVASQGMNADFSSSSWPRRTAGPGDSRVSISCCTTCCIPPIAWYSARRRSPSPP
ncbi:hypothetical protein SRABI83_03135 [Arthrobacter sp. Bi83]|nr:hypothetical protein SRABI83_03135 [Arthrobacter sp. Bi83]